MKHYFYLFFLIISFLGYSQNNISITDTVKKKSLIIDHSKDKPKAKYNQYRIVSLNNDTTFVDTTLTIQKLYKFNLLRKDSFGLLPFANEGQTYNTLNFGLKVDNALPEMGFRAKNFNILAANQINYYSVATPMTELYFKTVMEQGQTLETLIAVNVSERLNFSISYKGLRSLGKYINQLASSGNFVFTTNYATKNNKYNFKFHYADQDLLNGENGGLSDISQFESGDDNFKNRPRVDVFQNDASSYFKTKRLFLDQNFNLFSFKNRNIGINHQVNYENKAFEFYQVSATNKSTSYFNNQFGQIYSGSNLNDQTHYNKLYNKLALSFKDKKYGNMSFFAEDFRDNSYYNRILILDSQIVASVFSHKLQAFGADYSFKKNKYDANISISKAISSQTFSTIDANVKYLLNKNNTFAIQYQNISKLPNNNFNLFQSSYKSYNWSNNFDNEKINNFKLSANTKYVNATMQISILQDHLYFSNDSINRQIISPKQYQNTINYFSLQANKEFKFRKFALDNTLLFQEVKQEDKILNLPNITVRNTLYYSNFFFKKALFLQTGVSVNYFTKHFANDYNPITGEFFSQKAKKIGNFPMIDVFVNGRIRQTRIFFIAEHLNSFFAQKNYLTAPNYPYRDFTFRFGLVWNFFQ